MVPGGGRHRKNTYASSTVATARRSTPATTSVRATATTKPPFMPIDSAVTVRCAIHAGWPVVATWPVIGKIEIVPEPGRLYVGTMLAHTVKAVHDDGSPRPGVTATWRSSDPSVATVDRFGNVTALKSGAVTISAETEGVSAQQRYTVAPSPVASISSDTVLSPSRRTFRIRSRCGFGSSVTVG